MKPIKYPVGIASFPDIRERKMLYVDKTELIFELVRDYDFVFLSRPRRFGKSLLMSTLEAYFEGRRDLFEGLAISRLETDWGQYPIIRLDLSSGPYDTREALRQKLDDYLVDFEYKLGITEKKNLLSSRFADVIKRLYEENGRKVVILIDEYDQPLLDSLGQDPHHDAIRDELRGFYATIKACNEYLRFVLLTGVTRFAKVSIFSGLNNLEDISLHPHFNAICGITKSEMREFFSESLERFAESVGESVEQVWDDFTLNYDGYHFARTGEDIYNPYSVLKACKNKAISNYWFVSGNSYFLIQLIKHNAFNLNALNHPERDENALTDLTLVNLDLISLLFQSGYLTIKGYDRATKQYRLDFPNQEVRESFWKYLANYFFQPGNTLSVFSGGKLMKCLNLGDAERAMTMLQALFADTTPGTEVNKEIHFQNIVAIAFKMLGLDVRTEVWSSKGRCDMEIFTPSYIYILEFKVNSSAEEALGQIHKKGYARRHVADPRPKILIGATFSTEEGTLTDWLIDRVP